jgi:hypothetical protein
MRIGVVVLAMAALLTGAVTAQTSSSFSLAWYALAGGGARSASTHYAAWSSLGQAVVGPSASTSFGLESGYLQRWLDIPVFLPLVMRGT